MFAVLVLSCEVPGVHEKTAREFLDLYLAADQRGAIALCTGRARAQLQEEIDLLSGVDDREGAVAQARPSLHLEKVYEQERPGGDVAFLFRVELTRGDLKVPSRDVFVLVGASDGPARVKTFSFDPSGTHTDDKP